MSFAFMRPRGRVTTRVTNPATAPVSWKIRNFVNIWRGLWRHKLADALGIGHFYATVSARVRDADGREVDYGVISTRVVTTAGATAIVDAFQNLVELETFKFHGIGTGALAEAVGDTALGAELTTQYSVDGTRATGTTTQNGETVYRSVATNTVDAAVGITEHGLFSQALVGGVLFDRSVFAVINLGAGGTLTTTYDLTVSAGG